MRSTEGQYYPGLDHIRALAAFLVFMWHFLPGNDGTPRAPDFVEKQMPLDGAFDLWVNSWLNEGHIGVSIFMVLSGYLFAKIIGDRQIIFSRFLANRALRLLPLLTVVCAVVVLLHYLNRGPEAGAQMLQRISQAYWRPSLPNGGWSITVEFHFYIVFPLLLFLTRTWRFAPFMVLVAMIALRFALDAAYPGSPPRDLAYWTIIGRLDQFVIGMVFASLRVSPLGGALTAILATGYIAWFDHAGGWYSDLRWLPIWNVHPTIEAVLIAPTIAAYDRIRMPENTLTRLISCVGAASYSIYLLHYFVVAEFRDFIHARIMPLTDFYTATIAGCLCFAIVALWSWVVYSRFELYWLKFRRPYFKA